MPPILVQERLAEAGIVCHTTRCRPYPLRKTPLEHIDFTETPEDNRARMITQIQAFYTSEFLEP